MPCAHRKVNGSIQFFGGWDDGPWLKEKMFLVYIYIYYMNEYIYIHELFMKTIVFVIKSQFKKKNKHPKGSEL